MSAPFFWPESIRADFGLAGRALGYGRLDEPMCEWSGRRDSNPRSLGPEPSAIPGFATSRRLEFSARCTVHSVPRSRTEPRSPELPSNLPRQAILPNDSLTAENRTYCHSPHITHRTPITFASYTRPLAAPLPRSTPTQHRELTADDALAKDSGRLLDCRDCSVVRTARQPRRKRDIG